MAATRILIMNNLLLLIRYIVQNNPWYKLPSQFIKAFVYQVYKRVTNGILCKQLFNGRKILLFPQNAICSAFIYTDFPDKEEVFLLRELCDSYTIFLDIGANVGSYSLQMLDKVKATFAFEAHPETANMCKMNYLLNQIEPSQVICAAVCSETGTQYFSNFQHGNPTNAMANSSENSISVPAISLDDFVKQQAFESGHNFVIKMDVEGFEHEVFAGAKQFLAKFPVRAILFETFSSEMEQIKKLLQSMGYHFRSVGKHNLLATKTT